MNIVLNKTTNETYLDKYLTGLVNNNSGNTVLGYTNISNAVTGTLNYETFLLVPSSLLDIIERLNQAEYQGTLILPNNISFEILMNTLYSKDEAPRNEAIDYLLNSNLISVEEANMVKTITTSFKNFDKTKMITRYVDVTLEGNEALTDVIEFVYNQPVELTKYYDQVNNTKGDKLAIAILPLINKNFGLSPLGIAGQNYTSCHTFKKGETTVLQTSFIAIEMGDINDVNAEIRYDHIDNIEFIDSFRLRFRLPKALK